MPEMTRVKKGTKQVKKKKKPNRHRCAAWESD